MYDFDERWTDFCKTCGGPCRCEKFEDVDLDDDDDDEDDDGGAPVRDSGEGCRRRSVLDVLCASVFAWVEDMESSLEAEHSGNFASLRTVLGSPRDALDALKRCTSRLSFLMHDLGNSCTRDERQHVEELVICGIDSMACCVDSSMLSHCCRKLESAGNNICKFLDEETGLKNVGPRLLGRLRG